MQTETPGAEIGRSALLIVDMQNDFLHPDGSFGHLAHEHPEANIDLPFLVGTIAEPGGIYVSGIVYDQVADKLDLEFEDLGPKELKNIRRPIHVYRLGGVSGDHDQEPGSAGPVSLADFDEHRAIAVLPFANFSDDPAWI